MKIQLIGAIALSLVTTTAVSAQPRSYDQYNQERGYQQPQYPQSQYPQSQYPQSQYQQRGYQQRGYRDQGQNAAWLDQGRQDRGRHRGWGQDRGDQYRWSRGERMGYNDWSNARPVDYRSNHLRRPPYGYQWRESNGQYVLAALATGLIVSTILNGQR